jgi:hypothetical protein
MLMRGKCLRLEEAIPAAWAFRPQQQMSLQASQMREKKRVLFRLFVPAPCAFWPQPRMLLQASQRKTWIAPLPLIPAPLLVM